ncbi:MAG TPA: hypothetical protein VKW08_13350 [Xanthobacteraceae bacterium]|jgi:hypothetical protein|nr:hypothetical protein [Xanthobacteraceae bacterium]
MFTKTKVALALAVFVCAAPAVHANDIDQSASAAQVEREWQQWLASLNQSTKAVNSARAGYAYVAPKPGHKTH